MPTRHNHTHTEWHIEKIPLATHTAYYSMPHFAAAADSKLLKATSKRNRRRSNAPEPLSDCEIQSDSVSVCFWYNCVCWPGQADCYVQGIRVLCAHTHIHTSAYVYGTPAPEAESQTESQSQSQPQSQPLPQSEMETETMVGCAATYVI